MAGSRQSMKAMAADGPELNTWTVAIDTREQAPFLFHGFRVHGHGSSGDGRDSGNQPLVIPTEIKTLKTGDYSIVGFEDQVTIERKSIDDAINTVVLERERFTRELERMESFHYAAVVVEGSFEKCLAVIRQHDRRFSPRAFSRGVLSFDLQFRCKWHFRIDRRAALAFFPLVGCEIIQAQPRE